RDRAAPAVGGQPRRPAGGRHPDQQRRRRPRRDHPGHPVGDLRAAYPGQRRAARRDPGHGRRGRGVPRVPAGAAAGRAAGQGGTHGLTHRDLRLCPDGPPTWTVDHVETITTDHGHDALTADGAIVRIRAVGPDDRTDLAALYRRTSDENLYRRFLGGGRAGIDDELDRLTRPPGEDHVAVLAQERGRVVGVASYERLREPGTAEFALLVDDAAHGRGVGTLLLEQLAATGRHHGIDDLVGDILVGNNPMLQVARDLGPALRVQPDSGVLEVHVPTGDADNPALEAR